MKEEIEEGKPKNAGKSDEIDLIELFRKIWDRRKTIYKSIGVCFLLGLFIVILSPREYKSEVILLVESSSSTGMNSLLQQFGGLAGLSGLGSVSGKEALTPALYPDITKSTPFLLEMMNTRLTDSRFDSTLCVENFLDRHTRQSLGRVLTGYTIGLPGKLFRLVKRKPKTIVIENADSITGPLKLTSRQSRFVGDLSKRIETKEGESPNTLLISVEMQDPQLAAQLAEAVAEKLKAYIVEYRIQKAKTDLQFVEESYQQAKERYVCAQQALAAFKDRNMNIVTASAQITEQNLQSDYTIAFNLYNTLAQQREQARLSVQEKTPVFKVLEPAKVPLGKSKPRTNLILVAMFLLGGFMGIAIIVGKLVYQNLRFS